MQSNTHISRVSLHPFASLRANTSFVIASLMAIRRSNLLITLNTKRNVQRGDCFTQTHLPTLRFAMTNCCKRLLRRFAPRNDGKKETRNDRKKGTLNDGKKGTLNDVKGETCNEKNGNFFVTEIICYLKKSLSFLKVSILIALQKFINFLFLNLFIHKIIILKYICIKYKF